jgi:hypothetical protein
MPAESPDAPGTAPDAKSKSIPAPADGQPSIVRMIVERMDVRSFLAIELSTALIGLVFVLAFKMPDTDAFKILLGALISVGFTSAISWYFNSSSGSDKKDDRVAELSAALAVSTPPAPPAT